MEKILIVDDEAINVKLLKRFLINNKDYEFEIFTSPVEALDFLLNDVNKAVVDCIITDLLMPTITGYDLIKTIRAKECYDYIPIIVATGLSEKETLKKVFDLGATDYIHKPMRRFEVQARVATALKLKNEIFMRKEKEKELNELLNSFKLQVEAVNASETGIVLLDNSDNITWANTSFEKLSGHSSEHLETYSWKNLLDSSHITEVRKNDLAFITKDGETKLTTVNKKKVSLGNDTSVVISIHDITEREENKQKLYKDINKARKIQQAVLPQNLTSDDITIQGIHKPVDDLGGDMYYWLEIAPSKYAVILLDVMGHGIATSLITMYVRSLIPDILKTSMSPSELLKSLNNAIIDFNRDFHDEMDYYFTSIAFVVDCKNHTLEYVNAGHPNGIILNNDFSITNLESNIPPIGLFDLSEIPTKSLSINNIKDIMLYTDGVSESPKIDFNHMIESLKSRATETPFKSWFNTANETEFDDDVSLIHISFKK